MKALDSSTLLPVVHICNGALPALNSVLCLDQTHVTRIDMSLLHLLEGDRGHEALGLPGLVDLGVELVDLLETEACGCVSVVECIQWLLYVPLVS